MVGRAFADDAMFSEFFEDAEKRLRVALFFMRMPVYQTFGAGELYTTSEKTEGIAGWFPPGVDPSRPSVVFRTVPLTWLVRFAFSSGRKMSAMFQFLEERHHTLIQSDHWYLQILAVDPEHQGQGHASALLKPMLSRIDAAGMETYLETPGPQNVPMYEHFGFEVRDSGTIPTTRVPYWCMVREPQS